MSTSSSSSIRLVLSAAALLALAGCGNKGPLVMPQKPVPVEATPAPAPEATPPATTDPAGTDPAGQAQPVDGQRPPADTTTTPAHGHA